jgi:hypothetical protein
MTGLLAGYPLGQRSERSARIAHSFSAVWQFARFGPLRQRAERLLRAFDSARCLEVLRRFGRSAANAAARQREAGTDERDLRSLARKLLANVCRGDPDGVEYGASGGLLALRDGQELRLCFVAEEAAG